MSVEKSAILFSGDYRFHEMEVLLKKKSDFLERKIEENVRQAKELAATDRSGLYDINVQLQQKKLLTVHFLIFNEKRKTVFLHSFVEIFEKEETIHESVGKCGFEDLFTGDAETNN